VLRTAGVELTFAGRAKILAGKIIVDRKLHPAAAAKYRLLRTFSPRPDGRLVPRDLSMAIKARIPSAAAFEPYRDDVQRAVPVPAPRFFIDLNAKDLFPVYQPQSFHLLFHLR